MAAATAPAAVPASGSGSGRWRSLEYPCFSHGLHLDAAGAPAPPRRLCEALGRLHATRAAALNPHSAAPVAALLRLAGRSFVSFVGGAPETHAAIFSAGATASLAFLAEHFAWQPGASRFIYPGDDAHASVVGLRGVFQRRAPEGQPASPPPPPAAAAPSPEAEADFPPLSPCCLLYERDFLWEEEDRPTEEGDRPTEEEDRPTEEGDRPTEEGKGFAQRLKELVRRNSVDPLATHLFVVTAESNFDGCRRGAARLPAVVAAVRRALPRAAVLVDAARAAAAPLEVAAWDADFAVFSLYKIFGAPAGMGALVGKKTAFAKFFTCPSSGAPFGGGSASLWSPASDFAAPHLDVAERVAGTCNWKAVLALPLCYLLAFPGVEGAGAAAGGGAGGGAKASMQKPMDAAYGGSAACGGSVASSAASSYLSLCDSLHISEAAARRLTVDWPAACRRSLAAASARVAALGAVLGRKLAALRHRNGRPVVRLLRCRAPGDYAAHTGCGGGTVAFLLQAGEGLFPRIVPSGYVCDSLEKLGVHIRCGCFCNMGACMRHLGVGESTLRRMAAAGARCGGRGGEFDFAPVAACRVSLSHANTAGDVRFFVNTLKLLAEFFGRSWLLSGRTLALGGLGVGAAGAENGTASRGGEGRGTDAGSAAPGSGAPVPKSSSSPSAPIPAFSVELPSFSAIPPPAALLGHRLSIPRTGLISSLHIYPVKSCKGVAVRHGPWPVCRTRSRLFLDRALAFPAVGRGILSQIRTHVTVARRPFGVNCPPKTGENASLIFVAMTAPDCDPLVLGFDGGGRSAHISADGAPAAAGAEKSEAEALSGSHSADRMAGRPPELAPAPDAAGAPPAATGISTAPSDRLIFGAVSAHLRRELAAPGGDKLLGSVAVMSDFDVNLLIAAGRKTPPPPPPLLRPGAELDVANCGVRGWAAFFGGSPAVLRVAEADAKAADLLILTGAELRRLRRKMPGGRRASTAALVRCLRPNIVLESRRPQSRRGTGARRHPPPGIGRLVSWREHQAREEGGQGSEAKEGGLKDSGDGAEYRAGGRGGKDGGSDSGSEGSKSDSESDGCGGSGGSEHRTARPLNLAVGKYIKFIDEGGWAPETAVQITGCCYRCSAVDLLAGGPAAADPSLLRFLAVDQGTSKPSFGWRANFASAPHGAETACLYSGMPFVENG